MVPKYSCTAVKRCLYRSNKSDGKSTVTVWSLAQCKKKKVRSTIINLQSWSYCRLCDSKGSFILLGFTNGSAGKLDISPSHYSERSRKSRLHILWPIFSAWITPNIQNSLCLPFLQGDWKWPECGVCQTWRRWVMKEPGKNDVSSSTRP